jgi:hypothetical protein
MNLKQLKAKGGIVDGALVKKEVTRCVFWEIQSHHPPHSRSAEQPHRPNQWPT